MNVWFVTPAWGRLGISELVFDQRSRLRDELAPLGVSLNCVVIADDDNIDIAKHYGFDTVYMGNEGLGRKVNAGIVYSIMQGAEVVSFVGSDNWVHFNLMEEWACHTDWRNTVVSGKRMTLVDTETSVMTVMETESRTGVIPWLIPYHFLKDCHYRPIPDNKDSGLDYEIYRHIRKRQWTFLDPHPHCRVDFKSDTNITPYSRIGRSLGNGPEMPMDELRDWYGDELASKAEELSGCSLRRS